ncbi:MAG: hypothetical protein WAN39_15325 [Candidatus Cybelea sp.]|jgi:hypothetical protein
MGNILDPIPTWALMLGSAILIFAANELGFRFGRGKGPGLGAQDPSAVVQGAAFTVLALLLGFSFALALGRYDARRGALMRESNAIATTWLRSQLLDSQAAQAARADLRIYVAERIAFAQADTDPNRRLAADEKSSAVQRGLWHAALQSARRDPHSTMVPLFIAALNDAINLSIEERAVLTTHIPDVVIIGLLLIAFIASAMMGYGFGRQGQRALIFKASFAVMLAIAFGLVLDLDRPQRGLIRVSLAPLQAVQRLMETTAAQSAPP